MIFQATIQSKGGSVVLDLPQMPSDNNLLGRDMRNGGFPHRHIRSRSTDKLFQPLQIFVPDSELCRTAARDIGVIVDTRAFQCCLYLLECFLLHRDNGFLPIVSRFVPVSVTVGLQ